MTWAYVLYSYVLVPTLAIAFVLGGLWITAKWARRSTTIPAAFAKVSGALLLLALIPGADVAIGRVEFQRLCASSAGIKAYKSVRLEPKFRNADGSLRRELQTTGGRGYRIGERYLQQHSVDQVSSWPKIEKFKATYLDQQTGDVLGEYVTFHYWGGWLYQLMPGHHSAESCNLPRKPTLEEQVFPVT